VKGRGFRTTIGFLVVPVLSAVAPLLVVPAVARTHGADGWAAIAVGVALGNAGSVVADLGWTVIGPQRVAARLVDHRAEYRRSLASRSCAAAVLVPLVAVVAASLAPSDPAAAAWAAAGIGLGALSPAWYFVGRARPWSCALIETLPKCLVSVAVALTLPLGAPLSSYGIGLGIAALCSVVLAALVGDAPLPRWDGFRRVPETMNELRVLTLGRAASTAATALPTAVLSSVAPSAVATYAALDRPLRMGLQVLQAVPARMQAWLGRASVDELRRRTKTALLVNGTLGVAAGGGVLVGAPPVLRVLFGDAVVVPGSAVVAAAALVTVICASRGLGLVVVAQGKPAATTTAALTIAVAGTAGVAIWAGLGGVTAAFAALTIAESAGVVVQVIALAARPPRARIPEHPGPSACPTDVASN